jgi:hypothetical protein
MNRENMSQSNREMNSDKRDYSSSFIGRGIGAIKDFLRDTSIEVAAIGLAGAICAGVLSYEHEVERSHKVPLAFSEITQLERLAKVDGEEVGEMSEYYAKLNDIVMKTYEAWNLSWERSPKDNKTEFALELRKRMSKDSEYGLNHTYTIRDLLQSMPNLAGAASRKIGGFTKNQALIQSLNQELDATWTESHIDDYRTEVYWDTETYTDSDGKSQSRTVMKTRQVYDHTTHTYNYYPQNGENAFVSLSQLKSQMPNLTWPENLLKVKKVNQPNQDAIVTSRIRDEKVPELSKAEILDIVNAWNHGSTYNQNKTLINSVISQIPNFENNWGSARRNAQSIQYDTYHHFDSGPQAYQVVEGILGQTKSLEQGISGIINGLRQVHSQAPRLENLIDNYISALTSVESIGVNIDPEKAQEEIMKTIQSWYSMNIKGGFDIDMFRQSYIVLWTLLGAIAGGLIGLGVDKLGDQFNWYGDSNRDAFGRRRREFY